MVAVLLPSPVIEAGGLEMALGICADPDIGPGRGNHKRPDPLQGLSIRHPSAVQGYVVETLARSLAANAGAGIKHVSQSGCPGRVDWIDQIRGRGFLLGSG